MSGVLTIPPQRSGELMIGATLLLLFCVALSFFLIANYVVAQIRARRLINSPDAPARLDMPALPGSLFAVAVLSLLFAQSAWSYVLIVVGLTIVLVVKGRTASEQFGLDRLSLATILRWSLVICGAFLFVELPLSQLLDWTMTTVHLPHPEQQSVEIFRQLSKPAEVVTFLTQAVLISPLIEELFFRGFLFTFLKNYTTTIFALVLSAGVFAFAHANLGSVLQLWVLGIVLGLAYEHTGSLLLPMGIHACWNFLTAMSLLFDRGGF